MLNVYKPNPPRVGATPRKNSKPQPGKELPSQSKSENTGCLVMNKSLAMVKKNKKNEAEAKL